MNRKEARVRAFRIISTIVCLMVFVSCTSGSGHPSDNKGGIGDNVSDNWRGSGLGPPELVHKSYLESRIYNPSRVQVATSSREAAKELSEEAWSAVEAYQRMLVEVLASHPKDEVAMEVLQVLECFRLTDSEIRLVAQYLGLGYDYTSPVDKANKRPHQDVQNAYEWLMKKSPYRYQQHPAYCTILHQGKQGIPILLEILPRFDSASTEFENVTRLLFDLLDERDLDRFLKLENRDLNPKQRQRATELVDGWSAEVSSADGRWEAH